MPNRNFRIPQAEVACQTKLLADLPLVKSITVMKVIMFSVVFFAQPASRCEAEAPAVQTKHSQTAGTSTSVQTGSARSKQMSTVYGLSAKTIEGKEVEFSSYKGDVLLVVNTASECGFTPQYAGLESLQKKFAARGLKVLGFPCNQFGQQEPGDSKTIANFCSKNYGVTFQMFEKVDVNGKDAHPLFKYLTSAAPGLLGSEAIKWNFTKFLIDKQGTVVKRYAPDVAPEKIIPDIEIALK